MRTDCLSQALLGCTRMKNRNILYWWFRADIYSWPIRLIASKSYEYADFLYAHVSSCRARWLDSLRCRSNQKRRNSHKYLVFFLNQDWLGKNRDVPSWSGAHDERDSIPYKGDSIRSFLSPIFSLIVLLYVDGFLFYYFSFMRYFLLIILSLIALPTFASVLEWDTTTCTMPDGTFRESCIYATSGPKMSPRAALQDGEWESVSLNGVSITGATLRFHERRFSAKVCNTLQGSYGVFRDRLVMRNVISTRMYCEGLMELEYTLSTGRSVFSVGSDTLTIETARGDTIVWKKKNPTTVLK